MHPRVTTTFKASALTEDELRLEAPSIFASRPMLGVSDRYTFVPTSRIVSGLGQHGWVPVAVEVVIGQGRRLEVRHGLEVHAHFSVWCRRRAGVPLALG